MKFRWRTLTSLGQTTLSVKSATARLDSLNVSAFPPKSHCPGPGTFCELPVSARVEAAETLAVGHLGKDEFPRAPVGLTDDGLNLARNWGSPSDPGRKPHRAAAASYLLGLGDREGAQGSSS